MPEMPPVWSISGDVRGERALRYLPPPSSPGDQVLVACDNISAADAYSGVAIRSLLEYAAARLLMPVTLSLPQDDAVRTILCDLVGGLPNGVRIARGASAPTGSSARVILPAARVRDVGFAELVTNHLPDTPRTAGATRRELNFLSASLGELLSNALLHSRSPIDAIASVAHEPEEDELQLVVTDLGMTIARASDAAQALDSAWKTSEGRSRFPGGLASIGVRAERLNLDVSVSLYAGNGRLFQRAGTTHLASEEPFIPGFTAAVVLHR
jgi:hypothetical protein